MGGCGVHPPPPRPPCLGPPRGFAKRTTAVAPNETCAEGAGDQEERQNASLLSSSFNLTLQQTRPPPSLIILSYPMTRRENEVHVLRRCFIPTNHTHKKRSVRATAKTNKQTKMAYLYPLRRKHFRNFDW